jgi:hypothetical protein
MSEGSPTPDRLRIAGAVVVVVVVLAVAGVAALDHRPHRPPLDRAIDVLSDERSFDSSREAVVHFADVYQHLVDAAAGFPKDCDTSTGKARCLAVNQAASWSLNVSTASGQCTQPAIQQGRLELLRYLRETKRLGDADTDPPALPALPAC